MLTLDQAADRLGLKPSTVRKYAQRGRIAGRKQMFLHGARWVFSEAALARYATNRQPRGNPTFRRKTA
jgi:excisionase family DNA binding protein